MHAFMHARTHTHTHTLLLDTPEKVLGGEVGVLSPPDTAANT